MDREELLALLKKADCPVSGESLSRQLGVSRAAVWKAIEALRSDGYQITSAPRRGYLLLSGPDRIRAGELTGAITGCRVGQELRCLEEVDSTNNECKRLLMEGPHDGLVVIAEQQSGGRGRGGHSFQSPAGKGLYLSAVLQPDIPPVSAVSVTAWVAVAVCEAVEEVCGLRPGIKWTNDPVLNRKKLGGILTEMELEAEGGRLRGLVIGIGLNCAHTPDDFAPDVRPIATSLFQEVGRPVRRVELAAALIRALDRMYAVFPNEGKQQYLAAYRKNCVTLGKQVRLLLPGGGVQEAFAEELNDDFSLTVRLPDGTRKVVNAGEVSVRGLWGYLD